MKSCQMKFEYRLENIYKRTSINKSFQGIFCESSQAANGDSGLELNENLPAVLSFSLDLAACHGVEFVVKRPVYLPMAWLGR